MADDLLHRLMTLLDAAQPLLDRAAFAEKHAEAGKTLRCITAQQRAEAARLAVHEAKQRLGVQHG